jgi:hypothetical protein
MADTDRTRRTDQHFTEEDWVDVARGQGSPSRRARLQQHLDAGCPRCAQTVRLWREVLGVAAQDASYAPPDPVLRQARAAFALHGPPPRRKGIRARVALLFDSLREPFAAGVRASGAAPRHLLYKAGRYTIKLRVEPTEAERVCIAGQILDEHEPSGALQDIAVLAVRGDKTIDRTLTNHLGEFLLEPDGAEDLRLCVGVAEIGTFTVQPGGEAEKVLPATRTGALGAPGRRRRARQR